MGHWGWRPLFGTAVVTACVSVWVAGCNLVGDSAATSPPTPYPLVTLTIGRAASRAGPTRTSMPTSQATVVTAVQTASPTAQPSQTLATYTVQAQDTLLDIALRYGVALEALRAANANQDLSLLMVGQVLTIPSPSDTDPSSFASEIADVEMTNTPVSLALEPPTCYPTRSGEVLCLGRIINPLPQAVDRIVIEVRLLQPNDEPSIVQTAAVEQMLVPAGGFAPYRAQFEVSWEQFMGASATLQSADAMLEAGSIFPLATEGIQLTMTGGRTLVTGTILNTSERAAEVLRGIVTLQNSDGHITGYRVIVLNGALLPPGGRMPLRAEIIPQVEEAAAPRVTVYVEAQAGE